jgi:dihydroorotase
MMLLIQGGRLLDPANGVDRIADILVDNGKIARIGANLEAPAGTKVVRAAGCLVTPGLIDIHVHLRDPGQTHKEDIASGTRAAAKGGFVAVACMPNTRPVLDNAQLITYVNATARERGLVKVWPTGCVTKGMQGEELAEIGEMYEAGIVAITDDGKPVWNAGVMRLALQYAKQFGLPVMQHAEDHALSAGGAMHEGAVSTRLGIRGIPAASEDVVVARDIVLADMTGGHVHVQHISSARTVDLIRWAKSRGVRITCEATPHHFTLTDEIVAEMNYSTNTKMNPPLRTAADRAAIIEGLRDGTVDIIATDHAPHHVDDKEVEFEQAAFGITGLETALGLTITQLVKPGIITLADMVKKMSTIPAQLVGKPAPQLVEGAEADITVIDLDATWTVRAEEMASKSKNTPFLGWKLTGRAVATIVSGRLVMEEGNLLG